MKGFLLKSSVVKRRFVIGSSNILSAGVYVYTFQPDILQAVAVKGLIASYVHLLPLRTVKCGSVSEAGSMFSFLTLSLHVTTPSCRRQWTGKRVSMKKESHEHVFSPKQIIFFLPFFVCLFCFSFGEENDCMVIQPVKEWLFDFLGWLIESNVDRFNTILFFICFPFFFCVCTSLMMLRDMTTTLSTRHLHSHSHTFP